MGLLSQGKPLEWDETKKYAKYVQERGIAQFINVYNESKNRADGPFKWGDEVEYILVKFNHRDKTARVSLKAKEVFQAIEDQHASNKGPIKSFWNPEFASYMVEGTPGIPYGSDGHLISSLCEVQDNMWYRRQEVQRLLEPDETVMSITSFPRLGCPDFTHPIFHPRPETSASGSLFFPDEAIYSGHPRFETLVKNIKARRQRKVIINLPIFKDTNTQDPFVEKFYDNEAAVAAKPDHVYMDAMGFGMGCCCLQVTLQATHLVEAKVLYDQMAPLTPIALALSAASPIYRGLLTDRDCRWDVISCAVDDRTREESGETEELKESPYRIAKSRYDSISTYLSKQGQSYNDLPLVYDKNYYNMMLANGVDPAVARHIAHLFIREPITLYKEKLNQTDQELDHFENIQSTNWQTMRFKPPPTPNSTIGWRVEFRPLEAQTSDFENAAYVVFVILLSRVILAYKLNFLMPLSLVDQNMVEAQKRDAVKDGKFWFRRDILHKSSCNKPLNTVLENTVCANNASLNQMGSNDRSGSIGGLQNSNGYYNSNHERTEASNKMSQDSCVVRMTINQIINGCEGFVGVMPIISNYVESLDDGSNTELISKINRYLKLISDRAALKTKTTARFMRDFVDKHPKYRHDSVINDEVAYDLLNMMNKIGGGQTIEQELTGSVQIRTNSCFVHPQRQPQHSRDLSIPNGHSSNGSNSGMTVKKSSTLCNGFNRCRKSPSTRITKSSVDRTQDSHNNNYNRSTSR